jgi:predicted permease
MTNHIPNAWSLLRTVSIRKSSAVASSLVIGLGLSTALFCVADTLLFHKSSFPDPNRLITIWGNLASKGLTRLPSSDPDVQSWMERTDLFEAVAAGTQDSLILEGLGAARVAQVASVSTRFFPALQTKADIGRIFTAPDDFRNDVRVAILSHEFWVRSTGSDAKIVGRPLSLGGQTYTVIGVLHPMKMPAEWGPTPDLWIPLRAAFEGAGCMDCHGLRVIARLARGVSIQQAQSAITTLADQRAKRFPGSNVGRGVDLVPFDSQGAATRRILLALWCVIAIALLSTTTAAVALLTSDAAGTKHTAETGPATWASTRELVRDQMVTASLSAALAFAVAAAVVGIVSRSWGSGAPILGHEQIDISLRSLFFCFGCAMVIGFVLGVAKARPMRGRSHSESRQAAGFSSALTRLFFAMAILQTATAFVFTVGAGLMVISSYRLTHASIGIDPEHLLTMRLTVPEYKYAIGGRLDGDRMMAVIDDVVAQVKTIPGVRSVAATYNLPLDGTWNNRRFQIADRPQQTGDQQQRAEFRLITPGYFRTMNIPLRTGRDFSDLDSAKAPGVAIVNDTFVRQFWGNTDPIGKRIKLGTADSRYPWLTIVGVVGDVRDLSIREPAKPEIFQNHLQWGWYYANLVIRSDLDTPRIAQLVTAEIARYRNDIPITNVKSMKAILQSSMSVERSTTVMLVFLSIFTVLLEMITIYAVNRCNATRPAWPTDPARQTIRYAVYQALAASCLGIVASVRLSGILSTLLFGVTSLSYPVFALTLLMLPALNLVVASIATHKAAQIPRLRAYA